MAASRGRTVLGPLTTTFKAPDYCTEIATIQSDVGWQAQRCATSSINSLGLQDDPDCWPGRANNAVSTPPALKGWGLYSPGIVCPVGMTTACSSTFGVPPTGSFTFQWELNEHETAVGCCPSGYGCEVVVTTSSQRYQSCYRLATAGNAFTTASCAPNGRRVSAGMTLPTTATVTKERPPATTSAGDARPATETQTVAVSTMTLFAPLIQINWQASDRPTSSTTTSAAPRETSGAAAPGPTEAPAGLSTGATAGIAVSVAVVGLSIVGLAIWAFIKKRRRDGRYRPTPALPPDMDFSPAAGHQGPWDGKFASLNGAAGGGKFGTDGSTVGGGGGGGPMSEVSELPGSGGFGAAAAQSLSTTPGTTAAYPSPESGHGNVRTSYFQLSPGGGGGSTGAPATCYDETRAELESPPFACHEMPGTLRESSAGRAEMPGPPVVPQAGAERVEMGG